MVTTHHGNAGETIAPELLDGTFDALTNRERRYVLYYLLENPTASVRELGDVVSGWQHMGTDDIVTREIRDRTLVDLRHRHLPVLVAAGLVDYDSSAETVSLTERGRTVRPIVELARTSETGR